MTANTPAAQAGTGPHRYRLVHETRAEYVLSLPATVPDVAELLNVVRTALHAEGRPATDARVHQGAGGELVVSYQAAPDHGRAASAAPRLKAGFQ